MQEYFNRNSGFTEQRQWYIPPIGMRILKSAFAVFICLVIAALRGYEGDTMPTESAITAIICMQHDVSDTRRFALNRFCGTLVGCFWGMALLVLLLAFPNLGEGQLILYALMGLGVLISLYTTVLLHITAAASLASIVFLCVVIAFPDIEAPFHDALLRVLDLFIGTTIAIIVNMIRLPRRRNEKRVYFIHTKDLVPDRFARISPAVLFHLNALYNDGARICLMSEHAPAFFTGQMWSVRLNLPLIVMNGAAVYDAETNTYLRTWNLPREVSIAIRDRLTEFRMSFFIYTVHNSRTLIFHQGAACEEERVVYDRMRRSPYRDYLTGELYELSEIVYFKVIGNAKRILVAEEALRPLELAGALRMERRHQAGTKDITGLYVYSPEACNETAKGWLMRRLWKEDPHFVSSEYRLHRGYRSDRDGIRLLHRVRRSYEPLMLTNSIDFPEGENKVEKLL